MPAAATTTVIVIGSGGREHALGWKLAQSPRVKKVYFAPGNGGTFENVDIKQNEIEKLVEFAKRQDKGDCLAVVGPEESLSLGIADAFAKEGLRLFGPKKQAAMLETSKVFAKEFMQKAGIPTAAFATFSDAQKAKDYIAGQNKPLVVKADGLAAGKGVIMCDSTQQAIEAVDKIMIAKEFGAAGGKVVIEERLVGEEASFIALCDGKTIMPLASSQDHKRVFDGDRGPNTGGMGAYSPAPVVDKALHEKIVKRVMEPVLKEMNARGTPFTGFLYAGIMVDEKTGEPYVLEFNTRMGDPECQPIMMRMKSDLYEYIDAAVDGRLGSMPPIEWHDRTAVCVIMASRGYPGAYKKGEVIEGLGDFGPDTTVFHAGTAKDAQGRIVTNGGRVLGVTATGKDARCAIENAYSAVRKIRWGENGHYYRTDIARRARP
ncbi:phosphoribosylamine--glycine ligase [Candidatus Nitrososphaera evergladensis SR1]|uniref:Phosphoribosylamine--glycine ligase n=1 Tax=Candidatus Nitrososphaera evergladensis SR1 TaxID=1459636 RepID=A0A075MSZ3_9ARCH|nr:phosphoribosylamine--glycine ligase [Candidatus Nitrososphaera evergladensis]AIF84223.1 phosphoribosylamine--glycine ligase [Candidatus Nitrososphaera evergladensis SR1]